MTSSASTRDRRRGISTSTPRRWSLYARSPPIFTADAAGTGSSISPRRASSLRSSSAASGGSRRSTISPSRSPVDVRAVRSTSVVYRLSNPTKHEASLVARPDNMTSRPVANGSSVPAWPVRAPVRRRSCATIANDDGPAGLSHSTIPVGSSPRGGIATPAACGSRRVCSPLRGRSGRRDELAHDDLGDLLDRLLAREPGRLPVAPAAEQPRDRRDVELVDARPQAHAVERPVDPRRLADQDGHLGALDRAQVVDDPLG